MRRPCSGFHLPRPLTGARCCIGLPPRAAAAGCLFQSRTTAGKSISPICMAEPCLKTSGTSSHLPGRCERQTIYAAIKDAVPVGPIYRFVFPCSIRRHFEALERFPDRLLAARRRDLPIQSGARPGNECRGAGSRCLETADRSTNIECRSSQGTSAVFLRGGSGLSRRTMGDGGERLHLTRRRAGSARMISANA